jgi:pimeloyl-ACP methyl ester carboxylesterase
VTVRKGYVDTEEGQVHYRYTGSPGEGEPIVLLHQNTSSSDMFVEAMQAFDDDRYVVAPDTPGAGMSFTPERVPAFEYFAEVIAATLDALGVDRCHLCGHHTGASIAAELAVSEPELVSSVTFSGPPYLSETERETYRERYGGTDSVPPVDDDGDYLLYHWNNHARMGGIPNLELRHRQLVDALLARRGIAQVYGTIWDHDFQGLFAEIDVPRMVLCAPEDVLWDAFERLRGEHPSVRAVELEGRDYEPLLDADSFVEAVQSFVDE